MNVAAWDAPSVCSMDGEDEPLCLFGVHGGNRIGTRIARNGVEAEDRASDDAEGAESAGDKFGEVVAGNVFDDFASARSERAIGKSDGDANDEIAK